MSIGFVHLRTHSEYSLVDGLFRVKGLVDKVKSAGMPAVALTDESNLFAVVKFYRAAISAGIQPILGADLWVQSDTGAGRLTCLAMDDTGYRNLLTLISRAWREGQRDAHAVVQMDWLAGHAEGLICLTGATEGEIGQWVISNQPEKADQVLAALLQMFGDRLYLELTRIGVVGEDPVINHAVARSAQWRIPLVATNPVCFPEADDYEAHETRVCIHDGVTLDDPRRQSRHTTEQWLKPPQQMQALFADLPDALENTVEIAKRCGVQLTLGQYFLPEYPIPEGTTLADYLSQLSHQGLSERLADIEAQGLSVDVEAYRARLDFEVDVIVQMGFPGYFLIVADFIQWAKDQDIPVGPGRGSGAGSIVAWALKITDLDPIAHELLFERFLNPERVSMPDFDVDFCMEGRDRVIDYVAARYGREAVSQIVTFGSMAAKAVVRDVTRVQGKPYGLGDRVAKLIPFEPGMTLDKAIDEVPELATLISEEDEVRDVWEMAVKLEGLARNTGKHAGGVVIAPGRLTDFTALLSDADGSGLVTQLDKDDVEAAGLVKFDFLGLRTLTIIDWALATIAEQQGQAPRMKDIRMDDPAVFALLCRGETTAVFQLESRGMKDLIQRLKPGSFEDIVALVALFRPGPLQSGMVDDFIARKNGRAQVTYPHPDLEPILKNTYGVILYQEQVMQIAQVLANYSLGAADLLRRAMGKKKPEEMEKQRAIFLEGTNARGISPSLAGSIFDLMEKFAGYGFNKSHSAAYALVSYQTAFLKAHYPAEFMAAVLSSDMDNTDKVVPLIEECRRMQLTVRPPDVNAGNWKFTVRQGEIIYGLGAIKGLGAGPVEALVAARAGGGEFKDLFEFCRRVSPSRLNRRAHEALIRAGAFDALGESRWVLMAALEDAVGQAEQEARNLAQGIEDLFGLGAAPLDAVDPYAPYRGVSLWSEQTVLLGEKETLGLYLTGHPIDWYAQDLKGLGTLPIDRLQRAKEPVRVAGLIVSRRQVKTKRGETLAICTLDDRTARIDVTVFPDLLSECHALLVEDGLVIVDGEVSADEYSKGLKMRASRVESLSEARAQSVSALRISMAEASAEGMHQLLTRLQGHRGGECPIVIAYTNAHASGEILLGEGYHVHPSDALLLELQECVGPERVRLEFSKRTSERP